MKEKMYEKILCKCWELEEEEMLLPNRIVKDINQSFGNYGEYVWSYGWMNGLKFYVLFNNISVISG